MTALDLQTRAVSTELNYITNEHGGRDVTDRSRCRRRRKEQQYGSRKCISLGDWYKLAHDRIYSSYGYGWGRSP